MTASGDRRLAGFGAAAALAALAFLVFRAVIRPAPEVDFRFFWLAGRLWAAGLDPYSAAFERLGRSWLPDGNVVTYWFYPPDWWLPCRLLATLPLPGALMAWRLASGAMLNLGVALLVLTVATGSSARRWGLAGLACGAATLVEPTANMLAYGQSAAVLVLGLALVCAGVLRERTALVAAGLVLGTLKPQVGVLLFVALAFSPRWWGAIGLALAGALLLSLPQLVAFGPMVTLREFLANMRGWSSISANTVLASSGPLSLLARLVRFEINPQVAMAAALGATVAAGWWLRRASPPALPFGSSLSRTGGTERIEGDVSPTLRPLLLLSAGIVALVPLHTYDFGLMAVPLILAAALPGRARWPLLLCLLLAIRPGKVETLLGTPVYGSGVSAGVISLSLAALVLLALAIREGISSGPPIRARTT